METEFDSPEQDIFDRVYNALVVRQTAQLPENHLVAASEELTFDPKMAYELALEIDSPSEIVAKYGYSLADALKLIAKPFFLAKVREYRDEITSSGISFRLKAKIQAEDLLSQSYAMATDPTTPASVRSDLIKWTARVAGLEPSERNPVMGATNGGFSLNITFASGPAPPQQPVLIEGERL